VPDHGLEKYGSEGYEGGVPHSARGGEDHWRGSFQRKHDLVRQDSITAPQPNFNVPVSQPRDGEGVVLFPAQAALTRYSGWLR